MQILQERGYKTYRRGFTFENQNDSAKQQYKSILERSDLIYDDSGAFYYPHEKINDFTSMVVGGGDIRFVKDKDFDNEIIWGLSEVGKPPTLIYPRPRIRITRKVDIKGNIAIKLEDEFFDSSMNICLAKENHEDILTAMYNKEKVFRYSF